MKYPLVLVILAAFGSFVINVAGFRWGWTPLAIFLAKLVFLTSLAAARRGLTRPLLLVFAVLEAIPAFGLANVALAGPIVILTGLAILWRTFLARVTRLELTSRNGLTVVDEAQPFFDEFVRLGFRPLISADATGADFKTIFTYLVSADRLTYVVVTDKLRCLASRVGHRVVVTIDRAAFPTDPIALRQLVHIRSLRVGQSPRVGPRCPGLERPPA